jgi:hypothetical protein
MRVIYALMQAAVHNGHPELTSLLYLMMNDDGSGYLLCREALDRSSFRVYRLRYHRTWVSLCVEIVEPVRPVVL